MKIVFVGGSGFLGAYVARALGSAGHEIEALSRWPDRAGGFALHPGVRVRRADVHDAAQLARAFEGAGAVVSMAGILNEKGFGGKGFRRVHVDLLRSLAAAAREAGVSRILHVSALNAGKGDSYYLKTKAEGEAVLHEAEGLEVSIFQPSVVFGPGDGFFNRFAALLRVAPVLPLACPQSRLQPVYAGDVAAFMAAALADAGSIGRTFQLGGPRDYALIDLVRWTAETLGIRRRVLPLPNAAARLQASIMDLVPGKPFSTDNYLSLQVDNVAAANALPGYGIEPASIEAVVPGYLGLSPRQSRLGRWRSRAGR